MAAGYALVAGVLGPRITVLIKKNNVNELIGFLTMALNAGLKNLLEINFILAHNFFNCTLIQDIS